MSKINVEKHLRSILEESRYLDSLANIPDNSERLKMAASLDLAASTLENKNLYDLAPLPECNNTRLQSTAKYLRFIASEIRLFVGKQQGRPRERFSYPAEVLSSLGFAPKQIARKLSKHNIPVTPLAVRQHLYQRRKKNK